MCILLERSEEFLSRYWRGKFFFGEVNFGNFGGWIEIGERLRVGRIIKVCG